MNGRSFLFSMDNQMLECDNKFSVGISMIDVEHKKPFGILNKVIVAKEYNGNPEELWEVLSEMTNYTAN